MEQDQNGRLTALEERVSDGLRRVAALEQGQETLRRLATAVEVLATRQESMDESVKKLDGKLGALEQRPARRWESLSDKALAVLAGAFVSFLLTQGA